MLKWSMRDLAEHSGVAWTTVNRLEAGTPARDATAEKIVAAFAAQGVEIVADDARTGALLAFRAERER
ncbi:helix-turn-helix domain-containing protein [Brevundimonas sp.]|uniref:helix-turn-helix domain-containing protein n=1 Tax=Brevundimonas sp. TaxID=1871086 RepID=UPI003D14DAC5